MKSTREPGTLHRIVPMALTLLLLPALVAARDRPLPLSEAVAQALENNEAILVERASLASARANVDGARGAYDPQLSVGGAWERSSLPVNSAFSGAPEGSLAPTDTVTSTHFSLGELLPTGGTVTLSGSSGRSTTDGVFGLLSPAYSTTLGIELRQPLLRHRSIDAARYTIRVAAADHHHAVAELRREVSDQVAAVEQAYWTLAADRRATAVRQEAVRLAQEQQKETDARIQAGAAPETEAAQPRAELQRRRGELFATRETEARDENAMKLLILGDDDGAAWNDHLIPSDDTAPNVEPVDVAAALRQALQERPELAASAAAISRRNAATDRARNTLLPSLDAVVAYGRYGLSGSRNTAATAFPGSSGSIPRQFDGGWGHSFDELSGGGLDDTRIGLELSLPLGNRQARAALSAASNAEHQARLDLTRARKQVRSEVLDAAAALETTGQRIEAASAARQAAEVQLSAERDRYAAGISTNFLVLTRQNDLSRARLDEIAAQSDYRRAEVEMARATGALLAQQGVQIDDQSPADSGLAKEDRP